RGRALARQGREDEARASLADAISEARETHDPETYADAVRALATLELLRGNAARALSNDEIAAREDEALGDPIRLAEDKVDLGRVLRILGRLEEAAKMLDEARTLAKANDAWGVQVRVGLAQGRILTAGHDPAGALAAFREGL